MSVPQENMAGRVDAFERLQRALEFRPRVYMLIRHESRNGRKWIDVLHVNGAGEIETIGPDVALVLGVKYDPERRQLEVLPGWTPNRMIAHLGHLVLRRREGVDLELEYL